MLRLFALNFIHYIFIKQYDKHNEQVYVQRNKYRFNLSNIQM